MTRARQPEKHYSYTVYADPAMAQSFERRRFGGPIGEYVAKRVLGNEGDPAIAKRFRIPATEFDPNAPRREEEE